MLLRLYPLNGYSMGLGVEEQKKKGFQNTSDVMPLKNLIQPCPANGTGAGIPIAQTVQHDVKRSERQIKRKAHYKNTTTAILSRKNNFIFHLIFLTKSTAVYIPTAA